MNKRLIFVFVLFLFATNSFSEENNKIDFSKLEGVTPVVEENSGLDFSKGTPVTPEMLKEWAETAKNVKGKKLFCKYSSDDTGAALEFKSLNKVKISGIDTDAEKIIIINGKYKALSDEVIINYKHEKSDKELIIDRKSLLIKYSSGSYCELLDDKVDVSVKLSAMLNKIILTKSQGNKF